jgi:putative hydrolase of the HAD superfamily
VQTVLLDMDGTLLDLHFDDYFWQIQLPLKWGELNGMDAATARTRLLPIFQNTEGTLPWYCLDYWSEQLQMDVYEIKTGIEHLIQIRPHVVEFLDFLSAIKKNIVLVTNSHEKFIHLKMRQTGLESRFDHIFNAHSFGVPKEDVVFWEKLADELGFIDESTVLIDDNLHVLRSAREHGIRHLLSIAQPSSQAPERDTGEFQAVISFRDLCSQESP